MYIAFYQTSLIKNQFCCGGGYQDFSTSRKVFLNNWESMIKDKNVDYTVRRIWFGFF